MGVSGVGKTTLGLELAATLGWDFVEGDAFHSAANVEKMSRGIPLDDDDRRPWLDALARVIADRIRKGKRSIVACSALKRKYRERLRDGSDRVGFVHLEADYESIARRLRSRYGHFAKVDLLASQFETLEAPEPDEGVLVIDAMADPRESIRRIREAFGV